MANNLCAWKTSYPAVCQNNTFRRAWVNTHVASYIHILFLYFRICAHNFAPQQTRNPGAKLTAEVGEKNNEDDWKEFYSVFDLINLSGESDHYLVHFYFQEYLLSEAKLEVRNNASR